MLLNLHRQPYETFEVSEASSSDVMFRHVKRCW